MAAGRAASLGLLDGPAVLPTSLPATMRILLTLAGGFLSFLRQEQQLEIEEQPPARLLLRHGFTETVFDRNYRVVLRGGRVIEKFDAIRCLEVKQVASDESATYWEVRLGRSAGSSLLVGASTDDVEASVAAARISSMVGQPVRLV